MNICLSVGHDLFCCRHCHFTVELQPSQWEVKGAQGPTLYALAPWEDGDPPTAGQSLDALALLYYPEIYPGCLDDPNQCYCPNYRPKDVWDGGA
jgi:hypothetical protein